MAYFARKAIKMHEWSGDSVDFMTDKSTSHCLSFFAYDYDLKIELLLITLAILMLIKRLII